VSVAAPAVFSLVGVRDAVAAILAPRAEEDPPVLVDVVDALYPPALMLLWNDPWLAPGLQAGLNVMGPCLWTAHLQVMCVGSRVEPGPGIRTIETLVAYVVDRLEADVNPWPLEGVTAPRIYDIAGTSYLGARVNYAIPTTV
jgi:hypothetical protein